MHACATFPWQGSHFSTRLVCLSANQADFPDLRPARSKPGGLASAPDSSDDLRGHSGTAGVLSKSRACRLDSTHRQATDTGQSSSFAIRIGELAVVQHRSTQGPLHRAPTHRVSLDTTLPATVAHGHEPNPSRSLRECIVVSAGLVCQLLSPKARFPEAASTSTLPIRHFCLSEVDCNFMKIYLSAGKDRGRSSELTTSLFRNSRPTLAARSKTMESLGRSGGQSWKQEPR